MRVQNSWAFHSYTSSEDVGSVKDLSLFQDNGYITINDGKKKLGVGFKCETT